MAVAICVDRIELAEIIHDIAAGPLSSHGFSEFSFASIGIEIIPQIFVYISSVLKGNSANKPGLAVFCVINFLVVSEYDDSVISLIESDLEDGISILVS